MKNLFKRHYNAIVNRGLITPETKIIDFLNKIREEFNELDFEIIHSDINNLDVNNLYHLCYDENVVNESIDLIMTIINMLQYFNVDIEEELLKNVELQEKRANELNRIS